MRYRSVIPLLILSFVGGALTSAQYLINKMDEAIAPTLDLANDLQRYTSSTMHWLALEDLDTTINVVSRVIQTAESCAPSDAMAATLLELVDAKIQKVNSIPEDRRNVDRKDRPLRLIEQANDLKLDVEMKLY